MNSIYARNTSTLRGPTHSGAREHPETEGPYRSRSRAGDGSPDDRENRFPVTNPVSRASSRLRPVLSSTLSLKTAGMPPSPCGRVILVLLAAPLAVAVGGLAYRLLVLQARPQGARDRGQRGRHPRQGQIVAEADRVLEQGLEVVAWHEDPRRKEDEGEQHGVGKEHCHGYGQRGHAVVERRPMPVL